MPDQRNDVRGYRNEKKTTAFDEITEYDFSRSSRFDSETPAFYEDRGAFSVSENSFRQAFDTNLSDYGDSSNADNPFAVKKTVKKSSKPKKTNKPNKTEQESPEFASKPRTGSRKMEEDRFFMEEPEEKVNDRFAPGKRVSVDFSKVRFDSEEEVSRADSAPEETSKTEKKPQDSRPQKKDRRMKAGLFQYGAAAFGITLIALVFILLINVVGSFSSDPLNYTLKRAGEIALADSAQVWIKDQTIVTADANSVNAYNVQRSLLWNYNCALGDPRMTSNDQYAVLYDAAGTDYILMNQSGVLYSHSSDGRMPILKASVTRNGYTVLICGNDETQQLQLYSPSGDLLLRRSTKQDSSGVLLDAFMTDDGKHLVTLSLQYSDSSAGSQVTVFNLNQVGDGFSDTINSNFVFDDTLLFALIPMSRGTVVLGDNRILGYASGNTWKENWNERLTNRVTAFSASSEALALTFGNELTPVSSGLEGKTLVYTYGGDLRRNPEEGISYFQVDEKFEVYQQNGIYYCTNSKEKKFWTYAAEDDIRKVYQCGEQWILQTPDALKIMNLSALESQ